MRQPSVSDRRAETDFPIHDLLAERWSPRSFSDRAIDWETIGRLFEAARWAPSSRNEQPWRFIAVTRENPERYAAMVDLLMDGNKRWAKQAPLLIIGVAKKNWDHNGNPNAYAWYDLGQSMAHLTMQAAAEGLYLHQMGGFHKDRAQEVLGIPSEYEPVVSVAVGYLGNLEDLPEDLQEREEAARQRRALKEIVYEGLWNNSVAAWEDDDA